MSTTKALLVIDVQNAFFQLSKPLYQGDIVLSRIRDLIHQARGVNVPIIYLQHTGSARGIFGKNSPGWEIHPSISPREADTVLEKHKADAFCGTQLEQRLRDLSIDTIVVCGFVTEGCVDTTVRRAASLGFKIVLAGDAHSTTDGEVLAANQIVNHHNSILGIFAEVKKANDIHFEL